MRRSDAFIRTKILLNNFFNIQSSLVDLLYIFNHHKFLNVLKNWRLVSHLANWWLSTFHKISNILNFFAFNYVPC